MQFDSYLLPQIKSKFHHPDLKPEGGIYNVRMRLQHIEQVSVTHSQHSVALV